MDSVDETRVWTSNLAGPPTLRFLHYNDVYHVEAGSREPVGGFARFTTLTDFYQRNERFAGQPACLTFFSGDAFNPSLESSVTKGKHMVPALNHVKTDVACLGNHDLDFGVEQFQLLAGMCDFPWLCANVLDPALGEGVPLGNCKPTVMLTSSNGIKIGVIGLVEREWLDTINSLPPNLIFIEPDKVATDLVPGLRAAGAEIIVAVTHQRQPSDDKLAADIAPGLIDIILSGHDHYYAHSVVNGTHVLRSGTDYKQLSYIEARRKDPKIESKTAGQWEFDIYRRDVVSSIPPEAAATEMVEKITSALKAKLEKPIGYTAAPLDARFTTVRTQESNYGNFVCDIMRSHYGADACLMAAGTIRGDQIYGPGVLKIRDVMNCFPFEDPCVVLSVSGRDLLAALENSVSKYPALEGRFPQVSNIAFTFDASRQGKSRILETRVGGHMLELEKEYKLATRDYMARGKDGFVSLMPRENGGSGSARYIISEESGMLISQLMRQYFMTLKVLGKWLDKGMRQHWQEVQKEVHETHPVRMPGSTGSKSPTEGNGVANLQSDSDSEGESSIPAAVVVGDREMMIMRRVMRKWCRRTGLQLKMPEVEGLGSGGAPWTKAICPRIEGRIKMINGGNVKG